MNSPLLFIALLLPCLTHSAAGQTYVEWTEIHDLDEASSRVDEDPDGDGRPNIAEYILGADPTKRDAAPGGLLPTGFKRDSLELQLTFAPRDQCKIFLIQGCDLDPGLGQPIFLPAGVESEIKTQARTEVTVKVSMDGHRRWHVRPSFSLHLLDTDGDLRPDILDRDLDGDSIPNVEDDDIDGDGTANAADTTPYGESSQPQRWWLVDKDSDGIPDSHDPDIDGDGIGNISDRDIDGDGSKNGIDISPFGSALLHVYPEQTRSPYDVLLPEEGQFFVPWDLDNDGIANGGDGDVDGDGIPNVVDSDDDGDFVPDAIDPTPIGWAVPHIEIHLGARDVDGDLVPNYADPDIDGDGIANFDDPDMDGDGIDNSSDSSVRGLDGALTVPAGWGISEFCSETLR